MKRIYASLGMAAIGAASIQGVQAQIQPVDASKSWSVSSSLRGFYDDNVTTAAHDKISSYGVEVSPSVVVALPLQQTDIWASYTFNHKWYDKAINGGNQHNTDEHTFNAQLRQTFSERLTMSVQESFVIGQEPDQLAVPNTAVATPQWVSGNNIRNYGTINFDAQFTRLFGIQVGYANAFFDYDDNSPYGNSALLDRIDNMIHVDGRWTIQRDTIGIIGGQVRLVYYTGDQLIQPGSTLMSDDRNSNLYYLYAGVEHTFQPELKGRLVAGASYADYYNSPNNDTTVSPYVQGSLTYEYAKESSLNFGVSVDQSATDQTSVKNDSITTDALATVAYLSVNHRIAPDLYGSVSGQYQYSVFNGGSINNDSQSIYFVGVNLEYRINRHLSANTGYNFDSLDSNQPGSGGLDYNRNRVYIGMSAVY